MLATIKSTLHSAVTATVLVLTLAGTLSQSALAADSALAEILATGTLKVGTTGDWDGTP